MPSRSPSTIKYGLAFALLAALINLQPLCFLTYMRLFSGVKEEMIQGEIESGFPIPHALIWSPMTLNIVSGLARFTPAVVLALEIFLSGIMVYLLLRILNATFRMTTGVNWDSSLLIKTYMHTGPLIKAFLITVTVFLPAFALWHILGYLLGNSSFSLWLRVALVGAGAWLLFSRNGVAADYESGSYEFPREKRLLASLLLRGVLAGTVAWSMVQFTPRVNPEILFGFYHALGGIGEHAWWCIAGITLGLWAGLGLGGGGLLVALGAPGKSWPNRLKTALLPFAILVFTFWIGRAWLPGLLRDRYDFDLTTRIPEPVALARAAGIKLDPSGRQTILMVRNERAIPVPINIQSFIGVDAGVEAGKKVDAFLKKRDYVTALSQPAFFALHDAASLQWDPLGTLQVDYLRLTRCADSVYLRPFLEQLESCASTPATQRYADLLADESQFAFPDRHALELMGDIYARFGARAKAEKWYRRARLPESQIALRLAERTMFAKGHLGGQLLLDGKPVKGAWVGVAPTVETRTIPGNFLRNNTLRPYWLRWIATKSVTDDQGRFALDNLVAANYRLVVTIPGVDEPVFSPRLSVRNGPGDIFIGFGSPSVDLGTIKIDHNK
jgi:hypothetical protein